MTGALWRAMWCTAWLHNAIGVVWFTVAHDAVYRNAGMAPPVPGLHYDTWIGFVGLFGLAYFAIWRDPYRYRGLVILSIGAKLCSALPQLFSLIAHPESTPAVFALPVCTDLSYAVLFILFLRHMDHRTVRLDGA